MKNLASPLVVFLLLITILTLISSCATSTSRASYANKSIPQPKPRKVKLYISPNMYKLLSTSQKNHLVRESKKTMLRHKRVNCIAYALDRNKNISKFHVKFSSKLDCSDEISKTTIYTKGRITSGDLLPYAMEGLTKLNKYEP